jgi:hypothetical protein
MAKSGTNYGYKTDTLVVLALGRLEKTRTSNDSNFRQHMQIENFIKIGIL